MGSADIVPGISGGTIAFIMGFYEELLRGVESLNHEALMALVQGRWGVASQLIAWPFLVPLLTGIGIAMALLSQVIDTILNHIELRTLLYAAFFGMIAASVFYCAKQVVAWRKRDFFALAVGTIIAFIVTGMENFSTEEEKIAQYQVILPERFQPAPSENQIITNYDPSAGILFDISAEDLKVLHAQGVLEENSLIMTADKRQLLLTELIQKPTRFDWINPWVIFCGALAVCALLLPGISGSYLLQMLGIYSVVIAALADFTSGLIHFSLNIRALLLLCNLAVGITVGTALFSHLISWLLNKYRAITIAFLTGCMIGSLRALWPYYTYQYVLEPIHLHRGPRLQAISLAYPTFNDPMLWWGLACCLMAFAAVCLIERMAGQPAQKEVSVQ